MFHDWMSNYDAYRAEYEQFLWDVHILIKGTLHAGLRYLSTEATAELASIRELMKDADSEEYQEHLVDEHVDVLEQITSQERVLKNMALVALASRLTHALRKMARSAETFSPRSKRYGDKHMSEFARLWIEYTERFGIDFDRNAERIAFVEPLRRVRNQIVHEGSEANTLKPIDDVDLDAGETGHLDTSFSGAFPEYVTANGAGAEVIVSEELLDKNVIAAIELVGWLAGKLRKRETQITKGSANGI